MQQHISVLLEEVVHFLKPEPNFVMIDGTVGLGGHSEQLLARALPGGRLLGIDKDLANLEQARERLRKFGDAVQLIHGGYGEITDMAIRAQCVPANAILLDLGFSSVHVDDPSRGFSFMQDGPLDMRYDVTQTLQASTVVNEWSQEELARIIRVYGEELQYAKAVEAIVNAREQKKITSTLELANVIEKAMPRRGKIHPATRVFQAIRIVVNNELGELERTLPQLVELLAPQGRLAIISFHSLEDRIVKQFFKECKQVRIVTRHVVVPSDNEVRKNPRARRAKLRVVEKI